MRQLTAHLFFAPAQRVLGPLAFGDVRHRAGYPCWYSTFVAERLTPVQDVNVRAVGPTEPVFVSPVGVAAPHAPSQFQPDSIRVFGRNTVVSGVQSGRRFSVP